MKFIKLGFLIILHCGFVLQAQEEIKVLTDEEKKQSIEKICELLNRFYVTPEKAIQMKDHLKLKHSSSAFDKINARAVFVEVINEELQSICPDRHLGVYIGPNPDDQTEEEKKLNRVNRQYENQKRNYGITKIEILEKNIGYIKINSVMFSEEAKRVLSSAMQFLSNSYTIIFDLRENRGGDPSYMAYLFSYFFKEPTHINSIYWRDRDRTDEFWTRDSIPGEKMADIPLFVLISGKTFSGAEEFAYDLQCLDRATIVGEVSAGGAHPAATWVVYKDIRISIPYGRAINPITGTNWEGVGVKPDIETPADKAMEKAIELAEKSAEKFYKERRSKLINF